MLRNPTISVLRSNSFLPRKSKAMKINIDES